MYMKRVFVYNVSKLSYVMCVVPGLLFFDLNVVNQFSKLQPFWSPWRVEKVLATKILGKVANW